MLGADAAFTASAEPAPQPRRSPIEKLGVPTPGPRTPMRPKLGPDAPKAAPDTARSEAPDTPAMPEASFNRVSLGLDVELYHRFLWRGVYYSQAPVIQPSAWVREGGFEASVWLNVMLGRESANHLSLVSPAVGYQSTWERGDFGAGLLLYLETSLDVVPPTSGEAYATASVALGRGAVRTSHYVHYLGAPGAYYGEIGPEYDRDQGPWSYHGALVLAWASDSYNKLYFDVDEAAFNTLTLTLRGTRTFARGLYVSVQLEGSTLLHGPLSAVSNTYVGTGGLAFGISH